MILVVTEKNDAAQQIARLLSESGKPKADKVYNTPIYRFRKGGEDWVTIGLRGHIMQPDFPPELKFDPQEGWYGLTAEGEHLPADVPDGLARPPFATKRKPFLADGVDIKGWKIPSLPYLVWAPIEKLPAEKEIIRSLKNLAKKADSVIIGTDFDREGELIGSDALKQILSVAPDVKVSRARYSAFTKAEIDHAFDNLVALDQDLADAGESRQHIDLIWGAVLTRYLTCVRFGGLGNTRSAGRVQTPTLALVVERERERMAFVPEDYWVLSGEATHADSDPFRITHATARFTDHDAAEKAYGHVRDAKTATVRAVTRKTRRVNPPVPFNTTSMQAAAAAEGISPARAMRLAESLYMDGLISYPRVDNTVYPSSLDLRECVRTLSSVPQFAPTCKALLGQGTLHATRGKQETTDHPPIYPTGAANPDNLQPAEWKLYNLIARRFLATLMGPATIATGNVLAVPGFRAIYPYGLKKDDQLPELAEGDVCDVTSMALDAKQTEPPARYSQGKLIQEMEKRGLGTKSTRASIIQRLYDVKYLKNDPAEPSKLGMAIIDALTSYAPRVTTPEMTAELEGDMTKVAEGAQGRPLRGHRRRCDRRRQDWRVPQVRPRPGCEDLGQDTRELCRLHGLARLRRDVSAAQGSHRAHRRRGGRVPGVWRAAREGSPVSQPSVRDVHQPGLPHQPRARYRCGGVRCVQGCRPSRRFGGAQVREERQAVYPLHQLRRVRHELPAAAARRAARHGRDLP